MIGPSSEDGRVEICKEYKVRYVVYGNDRMSD
jgi:hypothetical protein